MPNVRTPAAKQRRRRHSTRSARVLQQCVHALGWSSRHFDDALQVQGREALDLYFGKRSPNVRMLLRLSYEMRGRGFHVGERAAFAQAMCDLAVQLSPESRESVIPSELMWSYELDIKALLDLDVRALRQAIDHARSLGLVHG